MKPVVSMRALAVAMCLTVAAVALPSAVPAADVDDVADKLDRVERDLRELQYEVYKGHPPAGGNAAGSQGGASAARLNDLEESLRELRGQVESLAHQVRQLNEQLEFSRKETNFRLGALEGGAPVAAISPAAPAPAASPKIPKAAPGASNNAGTPPSGNLGTLTSSDTAELPEAAASPRQQYDAAIDLLTRAQYAEAQSAFKAFVAGNPKDDLAGPAQYFVGEISFTQKDYKASTLSFAEMLKKYPKAAKAPDGMLKLGLSLLELGQKKEGCATLTALKTRYPNANKTVLDRAAKRAADAKCT